MQDVNGTMKSGADGVTSTYPPLSNQTVKEFEMTTTTLPKVKTARKVCSVASCSEPSFSRTYCRSHYARWHRHGDPVGGVYYRQACSLVECNLPHEGHGFCKLHYERWRKHGDPHLVKKPSYPIPATPISAVYAITHIRSQRRYIGSTTHFVRRCQQHKSALALNKHYCRALQADWNNEGADAFTFDVLEQVSDSTLLIAREQYWLDDSALLYNASLTAASNKGWKDRPVGWRHTAETKAKLSAVNWARNRGISTEIRQRMSEAQKRLHAQGYKSPRAKAVLQYTVDGTFIREWESARVAARELGGHDSLIAKCLKGKRKQTLNSIWRYK